MQQTVFSQKYNAQDEREREGRVRQDAQSDVKSKNPAVQRRGGQPFSSTLQLAGAFNLGSTQGVKVGDYFRVFRYQGNSSETVYQTPRLAYEIFGLGSSPRPYTGEELPRDILGEGVVLRVSKNAATVLITLSKRQMYPGDYVELE